MGTMELPHPQNDMNPTDRLVMELLVSCGKYNIIFMQISKSARSFLCDVTMVISDQYLPSMSMFPFQRFFVSLFLLCARKFFVCKRLERRRRVEKNQLAVAPFFRGLQKVTMTAGRLDLVFGWQ